MAADWGRCAAALAWIAILGASPGAAADPVDVDVADAAVDSQPAEPALSERDPTRASGIGAPGFEPPRGPRPDMFLHVAVDRRSAYVGEQVTVTWLLYTRHEVLTLEPAMPRLDDVWSEILHEPSAYHRYDEDVVDGVTYRVIIVSKRALFPLRPGPLTIDPFTARASGLYTPLGRATELASDPIAIDVKPLPDGAPPGFDPSYVGTFRVDADVDRRDIHAGESLTLTVTVRGHGAIRRTTPPVLDVPGFDFRAPRDFDEGLDPSPRVISGERRYRYWATPQRGGTHIIPPVVIPYLDPRSGAYQEARSRPITIAVRGEPAALPVIAIDDDQGDIRPIRDGVVLASHGRAPSYARPWFWGLAVVPLIVFIAVVTRDRIKAQAHLAMTPGTIERFRAAELHLRGGRPMAFFGELARIMVECIEVRIGMRIQSLTREELAHVLLDHDLPRGTVERLVRELEQCDFARFAATAASADDMQGALRRVHGLVQELGLPRVRPPEARR